MPRKIPWFKLFLALLTLPFFLWPGVLLVRDLRDPALRGAGIPRRARELHASRLLISTCVVEKSEKSPYCGRNVGNTARFAAA